MGVIFLQAKTGEQSLEVRNLKKEALKYAGETFEGHREQAFAALRFFSQCICIARQYGLLALDAITEGWDKDRQEEWWGEDEDIVLAVSMIGRDMPLKELLLHMMRKLVDAYDLDEMEQEISEDADGYSGYEWYFVYLYLTAIKNIQRGTPPEQFFLMLRVMVPEKWLTDYDRHCQEWTQTRQETQQEEVWEWRDEKFEEEISITTAFNRIFGEMGPEKIEFIAGEVDYKTLAAGIAFAKEPVRKHFLENMPKWQRNLATNESYNMRYYGYHWKDNLEAMDRMLMVAGLTGEA